MIRSEGRGPIAKVSGPVPTPTARFLGRRQELTHLDGHERGWLTVVGPPGVGKSRLVNEFAARRHRAGRGVNFCDLQGARDLAEARRLVLTALGAPAAARTADPDELIARTLSLAAGRTIVLDNVEPLLPNATETFAKWVAHCPAAVVVTSRWEVRLDDEQLLCLSPLSVPSDNARDCDAVALFIEAARRTRPSYDPGDAELEAIVELLGHLGGLPLAIELAASRLAVLDAQDLAERGRTDLSIASTACSSHQPDGLERQLWASWARLSETERHVLMVASLFRGPFRAVSVEALCGNRGAITLDALASLRAKSLVQTHEDGTATQRLYLRLLVPIRRFASDRLAESSVEHTSRRRFAEHFAARAEQWSECAREPNAHDAEEAPEMEDMVEAARLSQQHGWHATRLQILVSIGEWLLERWSHADRGPLFENLPEPTDAAQAARCATVHLMRSRSEWSVDLASARVSLQKAEVLARAHDCRSLLVDVDRVQAHGAHLNGDFEEAATLLRQVVDEQTEPRLLGLAQLALADALRCLERWDEAALHARSSVGHLEDHGYPWEADRGRLVRAILLLQAQRAAEAKDALLEIVDGEGRNTHVAQMTLGYAHLLLGELRKADKRLEDAERTMTWLGLSLHAAYAVGNRGLVAAFGGDLQAAARAFERAIALLDSMDAHNHADSFRAYRAMVALCTDDRAEVARLRRATDAHNPHQCSSEMAATARVMDRWLDNPFSIDELPEVCRSLEADATLAGSVREELVRARRALLGEPSPWGERTSVPAPFQLLFRALEARQSEAEPCLLIADDGSAFRVAGRSVVSVATRASLGRILLHLGRSRIERPDDATHLEALFDAGWDGEKANPEAARHRVYVALSTLRKAGLKGWLVRHGGGYRLNGAIRLVKPSNLTKHEMPSQSQVTTRRSPRDRATSWAGSAMSSVAKLPPPR